MSYSEQRQVDTGETEAGHTPVSSTPTDGGGRHHTPAPPAETPQAGAAAAATPQPSADPDAPEGSAAGGTPPAPPADPTLAVKDEYPDLSPGHAGLLRASGISPAVAAARGYAEWVRRQGVDDRTR